jgi:hypothetical protein
MRILPLSDFMDIYRPVEEMGQVVLMTDPAFAEKHKELYELALKEKKLWTTYANEAGIMLARPGAVLMGGIGLTITAAPYSVDEMDLRVRWDEDDWGSRLCPRCCDTHGDPVYPMEVEEVDGSYTDRPEVHVTYSCIMCGSMEGVYIDTETMEIIEEDED